MGKDPAFLFYSKDWITGTAGMMPEEKGVYIDLLAYQHQNGYLPTEIERLARIAGISVDQFEKIWLVLSPHFEQMDNRMMNRKLMLVMDERANKGLRNKIIGTFAQVLRKADLDKKQYQHVRNNFNIDEWIGGDIECLSERLTEWCALCLKSIANEDVDGSIDPERDYHKEVIKTWKNDFNTYMVDCRAGYKSAMNDTDWLNNQKRFHPLLDVELSIEAGFVNFWGTEAGWMHKKKSRASTINWRATIANSIRMNPVYITKK